MIVFLLIFFSTRASVNVSFVNSSCENQVLNFVNVYNMRLPYVVGIDFWQYKVDLDVVQVR